MVVEMNINTLWQEGNVDLAELKIHYYRTGGDKPPLLVAHGFSDNGLCWRRLTENLQTYFDVIMLDARNHGQSGSAPSSSTVLVEDIANVIRALGLEQTVLLGHSMGANTVAAVAARYPNLVSRVILEDPPWKEQTKIESGDVQNKKLIGFRRHLESQRALSEGEVILAGKQQHPIWHEDEFSDWAIAKQQLRAEALSGLHLSSWPEAKSIVESIQCPSLLIRGDADSDGIITSEIAIKVIASNHYFQVEEIKGAGHNIRREGFESYLALVKRFLSISLDRS